ncbi:DNA methyltransferase [Candidatus Omnitrophota bacterium]
MTELIWEGKYKDEKRIAPVRIALPFQKTESVNESAQQRQKMLDLFSSGHDPEWRNRLIWGDNKYVLPALLEEFEGKIDLIYIDPPFFTGTDQTLVISIPEEEGYIEKQPSMIEEAAYRNIWRKGSDSYMQWIYEKLIIMRQLLKRSGAIFIRHDQYWSHYIKLIADEVFGKNLFQNDIVVNRTHKNLTRQGKVSIPIATDSLFLYFASEEGRFENIKTKRKEVREGYWRRIDDSSGTRRPPERKILGKTFFPPPGKHFKFGQAKVDEMVKQGKIRINKNTGRPQYWVEPTDEIVLDSNWTDIPGYSFTTGYPTENSEQLLTRVIQCCSRENDIVADFFCGSGTTSAVAEKLDRKWIACDIGKFAIHTTRKRLLKISNLKPFIVQNLGKYERQVWQSSEFQNLDDQKEKELRYRKFILDLYKANYVSGYSWLHGIRNGRMVHVGAVDAPVTLSDIKSIAAEVWKTVGRGKESAEIAAVDILGWDFALEVNEVAKQVAAEAKVEVAFKVIPREVLEKKAIEQGDVKFFELASLSVKIKIKGREASVILSDFVIPPQDVPEEIQKAIINWSQWIDYWAIDWDYKGDTFHNQWQSYRSRKDNNVELKTRHVYEEPGEHQLMIKVIDILGNDTTKLMKVQVEGAESKKKKVKAVK